VGEAAAVRLASAAASLNTVAEADLWKRSSAPQFRVRREAELKQPLAAEDLLSIDGNAATELAHVTAQTGRSASWRCGSD
jgi:hypothetical protein